MKVSQTGIRKLSIIALTFLCSVNAFAKDNCDTQASLINPASLAQSGIGETGNTADNDGIGGTGIIGTITGFAGICVNGIEIHYDKHTAISADGRGATLGELAIGRVIAVRAFGVNRELATRSIAVLHAAIGPVGNLDAKAGEMQVLGQTVRIGKSLE